MPGLEELELYIFSLEDCFGFFVTGLSYGLLFSGIFFLVGLVISLYLKLIKTVG